MIALAVAALASCSKDKSMSTNEGSLIDFRTAIGTRATVATTANLTEFKVAAFDAEGAEYFAPTRFFKGESSTSFVSNPPKNWPSDESVISFYAYAPQSLTGVTLTQETKSIAFNAAATQEDLIVATTTGSRTANAAGVELSFNHKLSQIEVQAKNTNSSYVFKVKQVKIAQSLTEGSYAFDEDSWTCGETKADISTTAAEEGSVIGTSYASIMGENGNLMMVPQQLVAWDPEEDASNAAKGAYIAVLIKITTAEETPTAVFPATEDDYAWACIPINTLWEKGKKYIYQLDFSDGAGKIDPTDPTDPGDDVLNKQIKFNVNVVDWVDAAAIQYPEPAPAPEEEVIL